MSYQVLYRKYRSQTFGDLIGQNHVVRTLQNAISQGRVAHALLFTGPRGTGKTSTARLLAKALNCERGPAPEPCNECETCVAITQGSCMDVVEMDAASDSGVDDVREAIVEVAEYRPTYCRYKVYIIDEVHDLSPKAFDALLKTIEEPPAHLVFILATTELNKVPPTIRARCQKFDFRRGGIQDLSRRLAQVAEAEGVKVEPAALSAIARMADGGYRDALNLLEHAMLVGGEKISLQDVYDQLGLITEETSDQILSAIGEGDVARLLQLSEQVYASGRDSRAILDSLMHRLSDLTHAAFGLDLGGPDGALQAALTEMAARLGRQNVLRYRFEVSQLSKALRDVSLPKLWLESQLIQLAANAPPSTAAAPVESRAEATRQAVELKAAVPAAASRRRHEPPATAVVERGPLGEARAAWAGVVQELSSISKTAAARLALTEVDACDDGRVIVAFRRSNDHEWVMESKKMLTAIQESWSRRRGELPEELSLTSAPSPPSAEPIVETVEYALEGEALARAAKDALGNL